MIDTNHFKKILTKRRKEIVGLLEQIEDKLDDLKDPDVEERATEREDDEVMELQGNSGLKELEAIDHALKRIEFGVFGICIICNEPISKERLEAVPHATKCRKCM